MSAPIRTAVSLRDAIDGAVATARAEGRDHFVAWQTPIAAGRAARAGLEAADADAFVYHVPEAGLHLAAYGALAEVAVSGATRFRDAEAGLRALTERVWIAVDAEAGNAQPAGDAVPLFVGGFAFEDTPATAEEWAGFPPGRFWLPRRLLREANGVAKGWVVERVTPDASAGALDASLASARTHLRDSPHRAARPATGNASDALHLRASGGAAEHRALVTRALGAIARGELEKVVVARALDLERSGGSDPDALLVALRALYPSCASFALRRGEVCFLGATPERLLRKRGRRLEATALAGSAPRGRTPDEDAERRRELVESKKEQAEHAVAVRGLREALETTGATLQLPEAPEVAGFGGVQHLSTPIRAELPVGAPGLLELAGRVHPSAAVAGAPRDAARRWLAMHEPLERGWYAGLVGWVSAEGDGELSAALRCALLQGDRARLYAGGGVVAGSEPEAELRETRLKWNALLPSLLEL